MDFSTPFLSVPQLALVPLIMALVSLLKNVAVLGTNNRWAPLACLVLAIVGAFLTPSATIQATLIAGLTIGCISAGVYSGVKTVYTGQ